MRLIMMGAPGAGKGTQAAFVARECGVPAISTGDIFRRHVSAGTPLGVRAASYMNAGSYVPDEITNDMVEDRLSMGDARNGFILDGFPRTAAQVDRLDEMLAVDGLRLDRAVLLQIDPDAAVERLLERSARENREDDRKAVIRHRLEVFARETAPLVEIYTSRGLLVSVDALGSPDEVSLRVLDVLPTIPTTGARASTTHTPHSEEAR